MRLFYSIVFTTIGLILNAQLSGTYTIDNTQPTSTKKKNFTTISEAITAIEDQGLKTETEFLIADGDYYELLIFEEINEDGYEKLTFKGSEAGMVTFHNEEQGLFIKHCENINFENINFVSNGCNNASIIEISSSNNLNFKNCSIKSNQMTTSDMPLISLIKSGKEISFEGNELIGFIGFFIGKSSNKCVLNNNTIKAYNIGIQIENAQKTSIVSNTIKQAKSAIAIDGRVGNITISTNTILNTTSFLTQVLTEKTSSTKVNGEVNENIVVCSSDAILLTNNISKLNVTNNSFTIKNGEVLIIDELVAETIHNVTVETNQLNALN